jgi:hypothetical protein
MKVALRSVVAVTRRAILVNACAPAKACVRSSRSRLLFHACTANAEEEGCGRKGRVARQSLWKYDRVVVRTGLRRRSKANAPFICR